MLLIDIAGSMYSICVPKYCPEYVFTGLVSVKDYKYDTAQLNNFK